MEDPTAHLPHELLAELVGHPLRVRKDERAAAHLERAQDLVEDPKLWMYLTLVVVLTIFLMPAMLRYSKTLYQYGMGKLKYRGY